jgi:hypothetical protein
MKFIAMTKRAERSEPELRLIISNINSHLRTNGRDAMAVSGLVLSEMATAGKEYGDLPRRTTIARLRVSYMMRPEVWEVVVSMNLTNFLQGEEVMLTGTWTAFFNGNIYCDAVETLKNSETPSDAKILSEIMLALSNVIIPYGEGLDTGKYPVLHDEVLGKPAQTGVLGHNHD